MKFQVAVLSLLAASAQAFSPKSLVPQSKTSSSNLITPSSELWMPPMNMVAGGAERAREEYYEGTLLNFCFVGIRLWNIQRYQLDLLSDGIMGYGITIVLSFLTLSCISFCMQVPVLDLPLIFHPFCCTIESFTLVCHWFLL